MNRWGYADHNGPDLWHEWFPNANGDRQSPINIITRDTIHDPSLRLRVAYDPYSARVIINTGHTFTVEFDDQEDKSVISKGPLSANYRLRQFHFHWGRSDDHGSEHKVDGQGYAAELHIVHWDSEKYSNFPEAACQPDGLAVIGVFLKIGEHNASIERITDAIDVIRPKGKQSPFTNFDLTCLLPGSLDFWTYPGSLTVPPLLETVVWIVMKEPISISPTQLAKFRSLLSSCEREKCDSCCMQTNYRPVQPLRGRIVKASFP
ncbi:carbonic anhydrase 13-like [Pelobates fuscus]|uniref:carbonic anhydrase 13-like n=1 Tax=Pelobates fuscus TaxID=191477 RepID=UPI002FE4781F